MPAQRAILHDILVNKLNPNKPHADLSKVGKLKSEKQPEESIKEHLYAAAEPVTSTPEEVKSISDEPSIVSFNDEKISSQEEGKDESVDVVAEPLDEPVEEKPKKKLFQKKKSKDDVVL